MRVDDVDIETVIKRIGHAQIVWLNPVAAARRTWSSTDDFAVCAEVNLEVLEHVTQVITRERRRYEPLAT